MLFAIFVVRLLDLHVAIVDVFLQKRKCPEGLFKVENFSRHSVQTSSKKVAIYHRPDLFSDRALI